MTTLRFGETTACEVTVSVSGGGTFRLFGTVAGYEITPRTPTVAVDSRDAFSCEVVAGPTVYDVTLTGLRPAGESMAFDVDPAAALAAWENLSPHERGFVRALLADRLDLDAAEIFADYLEEDGRTAAGDRVRRLAVRDGDVLVLTVPEDASFESMARLGEEARTLANGLLDGGLGGKVRMIVVRDGVGLTNQGEDMMRATGRVRALSSPASVAAALRSLTPDERAGVLRAFCRECGSDDPRCRCRDDS